MRLPPSLPSALLLLLTSPLLASPPPTTLLFVDDHDILYRTGTQRILTPLTRHPANPLIKPEHPWESLIAYCTVARDEHTGRTQLWYQSYAGPVAHDRTRSCTVSYAESPDGLHFTKPLLPIFPFNDTKQTNIVLVANGGTSDRYANSVLLDPADPDPARRYKMGYFDFAPIAGTQRVPGDPHSPKDLPGLHVAFSPDGIHWTKHPAAPLLPVPYVNYEDPVPLSTEAKSKPLHVPLTMADAVDIFYDPARHTYVWTGKMWLDGPAGTMAFKHAMGRSESPDFLHWSQPQLVCAPDDLDPPTAEFHTSPAFYHAGVYFCLNQILDRATDGGVMNVELMTSRDGLHWDRNFRHTWFLPRNPTPNAFDSGSLFTNSTPLFPSPPSGVVSSADHVSSPAKPRASALGPRHPERGEEPQPSDHQPLSSAQGTEPDSASPRPSPTDPNSPTNQIRFYYGGYAHGATGGDDSAATPSGIGLATLPLDRFAGIRPLPTTSSPTLHQPLHDIGQITLKPLDLSQVKSVTLNADASHGSIRVELLTEDGYRVPNYTADDATPITGDSLRHAVTWNSHPTLPPGRYMLRLLLQNATAYAVTLHP